MFGDEVLTSFGIDLVEYSQTPRFEFTRGQSSLALDICLFPSLGHRAVPVTNANDWPDDQSSGQNFAFGPSLSGEARDKNAAMQNREQPFDSGLRPTLRASGSRAVQPDAALLPLSPAELLAQHAEVVEARIADQEHAIG